MKIKDIVSEAAAAEMSAGAVASSMGGGNGFLNGGIGDKPIKRVTKKKKAPAKKAAPAVAPVAVPQTLFTEPTTDSNPTA